jgi:phage regulator Rha-like protein
MMMSGKLISSSVITTILSSIVNLEDGPPITTSLKITELFEKQHKNILQSIDYLIAQLEKPFAELNFQLTYEINQIGNTILQSSS